MSATERSKDITALKEKLAELKSCCKKYGAAEVHLDFERNFYGFVAASIVCTVLGCYGKDVLLGFLSDVMLVPDKVRRRSFEGIAAHVVSRWFQVGAKLMEKVAYVMSEVHLDDPELALKRCGDHGMPPHALWALAKYHGRDELAASLPGAPFFTEEDLEWFRLRYEIAACFYALRKLDGDAVRSVLKREVEEKTFSYRTEIDRLKKKLARTPELVAQKVAEVENYRELYERAKSELEDAQRRFAELAGQYEKKIAELEREVAALKEALAARDGRFLEGMTVCVIGDDSHKAGYEAVVAERGGSVRFISGIEDTSLVRDAVRSPDVVCNPAGLGTFREAVGKLRGQLEKAV